MFPILFTLLLVPASAQTLGGVWTNSASHPGTLAGDHRGTAVTAAGDLNLDGKPDYAVASRSTLWAYNGATHALLFSVPTGTVGEQVLAGIGDVNGDGRGDLALGTPSASANLGNLRVFSGTGGMLWNLAGSVTGGQLGFSLDGAGDQNGNGLADLIVGLPTAGGTGQMMVLDGLTGALIHAASGPVANSGYGYGVTGGMDVDADGFDDLAVGAPFEKIGTDIFCGNVYVISGNGFGSIRTHAGTRNAFLGKCVDMAGDLNLDGYADLLVSRDTNSSHDSSVRAYNGRNGNIMYTVSIPEIGVYLPNLLAGGGISLDPDDLADFAVGIPMLDPAGLVNAGGVRVFNGFDGSLMQEIPGGAPGDAFGSSVAVYRAPVLDLGSALVIGAKNAAPGGLLEAGFDGVWNFLPCLTGIPNYFTASVQSTVQLRYDFPASAAGYAFLLVVGKSGPGLTMFNGLAIPLANDALVQASLAGSYPAGITTSGTSGVLNAQGNATGSLKVNPLPPQYVGLSLYLAAIAGPNAASYNVSSISVQILVQP